jgi:hypothetical protein
MEENKNFINDKKEIEEREQDKRKGKKPVYPVYVPPEPPRCPPNSHSIPPIRSVVSFVKWSVPSNHVRTMVEPFVPSDAGEVPLHNLDGCGHHPRSRPGMKPRTEPHNPSRAGNVDTPGPSVPLPCRAVPSVAVPLVSCKSLR